MPIRKFLGNNRMLNTKLIFWKSLKWSVIIEVTLTLTFVLSALILPIHSTLFVILSMTIYSGVFTTKKLFPLLYSNSFLIMIVTSFVVQLIYICILLFMILCIINYFNAKKDKI